MLQTLIESQHLDETRKVLLKTLIPSYPNEYTKLSLERRANAFSVETLYRIESVYGAIAAFSPIFESEFDKYLNNTIDLAQLKDKLQIRGLKLLIDSCLELLDQEVR
jgi:hypothetical protein